MLVYIAEAHPGQILSVTRADGRKELQIIPVISTEAHSLTNLKELVITDSIQPTEAVRVARNIRVLSVSTLIGEAIARTAAEESVSSLFD